MIGSFMSFGSFLVKPVSGICICDHVKDPVSNDPGELKTGLFLSRTPANRDFRCFTHLRQFLSMLYHLRAEHRL